MSIDISATLASELATATADAEAEISAGRERIATVLTMLAAMAAVLGASFLAVVSCLA